ncbi:AAA family ATPase [Exiguobacterium sp. s193]|uniref:AAA family ATPase n=1 Tax=Exiguobacterium sp. s193 TaxID=2751207 RepID=UPI003336C50D
MVRLVLQCRYATRERGRRPSKEDLIRHGHLLDAPFLEGDEFHYVTELGSQAPDLLRKQIKNGENKKIELVYTHIANAQGETQDRKLSDGLRRAIEKIIPSYEAILEVVPSLVEEQVPAEVKNLEGGKAVHPKNMILQGPPGTGKTYHTVLYAVAIIEGKAINEINEEGYAEVKKRYATYRDENRIAFTTFHQSYGYEEFIEGIKPVVTAGSNEVGFNIESGIFKEFCDLAAADHRFGGHDVSIDADARIWKVSLGGAGEHPLKESCFKDGMMRIGWDGFGEDPFMGSSSMNPSERSVLNYFYETMEVGDIVLSLKDEHRIDGIGIIDGDAEWLEDEARYKRSRKVNWLAKNISLDIYEMNLRKKLTQKTVYPLDRLSVSQVERMLEEESGIRELDDQSERPYVFIVDEINRGNISKILGELITLIEPSKRLGEVEETLVKLPYSKKEFGVPNNIYIIGTMNTADRSIALMDTALRRRFRFIEMSPDPSILQGVSVGGVDLECLLDVMNRRIEALYDRDHMIGHAYFTGLSSDDDVDALKEIFLKSIIPLLQEYFFDDHEKIRAVLGDDQRKNGPQILMERPDLSKLFGSSIYNMDLEKTYRINSEALDHREVYEAIYAGHHAKV